MIRAPAPIVYAFTLSIYTASTAVPETLNNAAIAIVDEDQSPVSSRILTAFYPPYFSPPKLISQYEMDRRMDTGKDTFAIDIPPNFQRDLLAGKSPTIQLNVDATRMTQAFNGSSYIQSILSSEISEFLNRYRGSTSLPVSLAMRTEFNQELNRAWFGAVTNVIFSTTILSIILTGAALIREREHETIEHLLVMPVTPTEIMLSKIWSMGLVVLAATAFSLAFVVQGFLHVEIRGSLALFLFGAVLFRAGDAPVEGIEQPREHQAQHGVERLVLRGGIEAAKPQQQREIGCDHGVVVNSDHKKPSDPFGLQHHYTRRRRESIAKMLTRLLAVV